MGAGGRRGLGVGERGGKGGNETARGEGTRAPCPTTFPGSGPLAAEVINFKFQSRGN